MYYGNAENQMSNATVAVPPDRASVNYGARAATLLGTALDSQKRESEIHRELQVLQRSLDYVQENLRSLAERLAPVIQPMVEEKNVGASPMPAINTDMGLKIFHMNAQAYSAAREIASLVERLGI